MRDHDFNMEYVSEEDKEIIAYLNQIQDDVCSFSASCDNQVEEEIVDAPLQYKKL